MTPPSPPPEKSLSAKTRRAPTTLRGRVLGAILLFGSSLVVIYACLMLFAMQRLEDNIFIQRLDRRADEIAAELEQRGVDGEISAEGFDAFHVYIGADSLPAHVPRQIADWPPGDYEFHDSLMVSNRNEHFVAIRDVAGSDHRLYVIYDARAFRDLETWWTPIFLLLGGGAALVVALGWPIGRRLADQVASPLTQLADIVESSSTESLAGRLEALDATGEVAVLRDALRRAMDRVAASVERERRFTRNASHELRTPLTVMRGAAELLERQLADDAKAIGRLGRIHRSLDYMSELIEAFLGLARQDQDTQHTSSHLEDIIPAVVERCQAAERGAVTVRQEIGNPLALAAPAPIVATTLGNLLSNAMQLTAEGTVLIRLKGSRLEIHDRGPGIPAGHEDELSEPFISHRSGGTGLGLAIVREICERYGWRLSFHPAPGGGTITRLDLVVQDPAVQDPAAQNPPVVD